MAICTEKTERRPRRHVSDEEFRRAYYGVKGDAQSLKEASDNRHIIMAVLRKYQGRIPEEDLESLGLCALWRALQYHRPEFGQKFTTSLYRFATWECNRELRRRFGKANQKKDHAHVPLFEQHLELLAVVPDKQEEDVEHIRECVELLPHEWMRQVVRQYFFDGLTMEAIGRANGYSKEAARHKIKKATALLRQICHESLEPDGVLAV